MTVYDNKRKGNKKEKEVAFKKDEKTSGDQTRNAGQKSCQAPQIIFRNIKTRAGCARKFCFEPIYQVSPETPKIKSLLADRPRSIRSHA